MHAAQAVGIAGESFVQRDAHRGHFAAQDGSRVLEMPHEVGDRPHPFGELERLFIQPAQIPKRRKVQNLNHGVEFKSDTRLPQRPTPEPHEPPPSPCQLRTV